MTLIHQSEVKQTIEVNWADRWQVYQRLQELAIPCSCEIDQPLKVHITDGMAAVQLWSVLKLFTQPRQELVCWLERCWHYKA